MIVGFGRSLPKGRLPVYSVGDEAEARLLLAMACPMNAHGDYVAVELAREQTLANLQRFSDRLDCVHEMLKANGRCRCSTT